MNLSSFYLLFYRGFLAGAIQHRHFVFGSEFRHEEDLALHCRSLHRFFLLIAASVVLGQLLSTGMPIVLPILRIVGCLFMLYLTYQVYTMDVSKSGTNQTASFTSGFLMQFLNPKVVLFTLTVIPATSCRIIRQVLSSRRLLSRYR